MYGTVLWIHVYNNHCVIHCTEFGWLYFEGCKTKSKLMTPAMHFSQRKRIITWLLVLSKIVFFFLLYPFMHMEVKINLHKVVQSSMHCFRGFFFSSSFFLQPFCSGYLEYRCPRYGKVVWGRWNGWWFWRWLGYGFCAENLLSILMVLF